MVKVFRKFKTKHLAKSYCHIRISGKIKVYLQSKGDCIQPKENNAFFSGAAKGGAKFRKSVGKQNLFAKPNDKALGTVAAKSETVLSTLEAFFNVRISYYRTRNKLGEHCDICAEAYGIFLRRKAPVNICGIADELKGIKAYSDRKRKAQKRNGKPGCGIKI